MNTENLKNQNKGEKEQKPEVIGSGFIHEICNSAKNFKLGGFSILAMDGGEDSWSLLFCKECWAYFLDLYHECFMDDGDINLQRQIKSDEAEMIYDLILGCETPFDKDCDCSYHHILARVLFETL